MCTAYDIVCYCCKLFHYEKAPLALCKDLFGFETAKKSVFATRILMYSIAANMVLGGDY